MLEIYEYAFDGCEILRHIRMPVHTVINSNAFVECSEKTTIERY